MYLALPALPSEPSQILVWSMSCTMRHPAGPKDMVHIRYILGTCYLLYTSSIQRYIILLLLYYSILLDCESHVSTAKYRVRTRVSQDKVHKVHLDISTSEIHTSPGSGSWELGVGGGKVGRWEMGLLGRRLVTTWAQAVGFWWLSTMQVPRR